MKPNQALDYVITCVGQAEADGHQQFEDVGEGIPDKVWVDGNILFLRFGREVFKLSCTKCRQYAKAEPA